MSDHPIQFSEGLPTTVLPEPDPAVRHRLAQALAAAAESDRPQTDRHVRRDAVSAVVADHPKELECWAALGDAGRDPVERYAAYRIGYHRGLDALRAHGWRGSGYVRWSAPSNRGFLRSLLGLQRMAALIGEDDEAERCALFLGQLDPDGPPDDVLAELRASEGAGEPDAE